MTKEKAIESFKYSNEQARVRLEVEKMRMDSGEIKELEFYIERDEMAIKALEQEPKTGHWIITCKSYITGFSIKTCSICNTQALEISKYCPNCGARMIEQKESEDVE